MLSNSAQFLLIAPPGWTLYSGGPHLAMPLLASGLKSRGVDVTVRDLNAEISAETARPIAVAEIIQACSGESLRSMNDVYFASQRPFETIAAPYDAAWDLRLGFSYNEFSCFSSRQSLLAADLESPFTSFYRQSVVPAVLEQQPDVVALGIACIQQMVPALQLCRVLREAGFRGLVVLGGNTISRIADTLTIPRLFQWVDAYAVYQGENTMMALAEVVMRGRDFATVPNVIWWDGTSAVSNPIANDVDADAVPTPCFDGLPLQLYWGAPFLPLLSARGCYHARCAFCAIPYGWGRSRFGGTRSAERVYEDIVALVESHGITNFKFVDESMPPATIRRLAQLLVSRGVRIKWEAYTRLEKAWGHSDLADIAAQSGFVKAYFGVELAPGENRLLLEKGDTVDPLPIFRRCREAGILVHMFAMLGFPGTNANDAQRTVELAVEHVDPIDTLDIFSYGCARGTAVPAGVRLLRDPDLDWALEFPFEPSVGGVMGSQEVEDLANFYEEFVFEHYPRLVHPIYRLISPWRTSEIDWRSLGLEDVPPAGRLQVEPRCR